LLSNAVKFTPDGGKVLINWRKLPGFFEITISDTGIGIDPEDQMIIFDKFTRIGSTSHLSSRKMKFKGGGPGPTFHVMLPV
jgi:signal transduction histidine kinase